jgi:hypothetical protein
MKNELRKVMMELGQLRPFSIHFIHEGSRRSGGPMKILWG